MGDEKRTELQTDRKPFYLLYSHIILFYVHCYSFWHSCQHLVTYTLCTYVLFLCYIMCLYFIVMLL